LFSFFVVYFAARAAEELAGFAWLPLRMSGGAVVATITTRKWHNTNLPVCHAFFVVGSSLSLLATKRPASLSCPRRNRDQTNSYRVEAR
jgi:hypothetical protein